MPIQDIKPALTRIAANNERYKEFYDYYAGDHQLNFASDKFKNKFGRRLQKLRENLCKTVVTAPSSRLEIINFLADNKNTENPAWKIWKQSKMPLHSEAIHREAFKTGDAYIICWTDEAGAAQIYSQLAANMTVWTNRETGKTEKAAKCWRGDDGFYYLNLYFADRIEKYVTRGKYDSQPLDEKAFDIRRVQGEPFPLPNPFGSVPVFHFKFDAEMQDTGNSLLNDVIPLNDALNKSFADIMGAQEENMRRRRFAAGMQVETDDETGRKINPFKPDDDVWFSGDSETKFGEFSEADVEKMLKVKEDCVRAIALVSGIPPSYFNLETANFPSGEALRKIEARFTAIVQSAQRAFGETWADAMNFCLQLQGETVKLEIETQWTDAAPVSETEALDNASKKIGLGWSYEQVQRDYGLTDDQIEKMKTENKERETSKMQVQQRFFDAGNNLTEKE